jgi:hypothetical protein
LPLGSTELWQGSASLTRLQFEVRTSHTLTSFNGFTLAKEDFANRTISLETSGGSFSLPGDGTYTETYSRVGESGSDLFSSEQRVKLDAFGRASSFLVKLLGWIGIDKVIREYRSLPLHDPYRDRAEFRADEMWQIQDFTDLDCYRSERGVLRVRNLSLTPLSIGEALERRLAFSPSLVEKEAYKHRANAATPE